jgi:hypothetical protein
VQTLAAYNPLTQLPLAAGDALARMWINGPFGNGPYPAGYGGYASPAGYPMPAPPAPAPPNDGDAHTAEPDGSRADDVAAMRRELAELKQALHDGLASKRRKRKP